MPFRFTLSLVAIFFINRSGFGHDTSRHTIIPRPARLEARAGNFAPKTARYVRTTAQNVGHPGKPAQLAVDEIELR